MFEKTLSYLRWLTFEKTLFFFSWFMLWPLFTNALYTIDRWWWEFTIVSLIAWVGFSVVNAAAVLGTGFSKQSMISFASNIVIGFTIYKGFWTTEPTTSYLMIGIEVISFATYIPLAVMLLRKKYRRMKQQLPSDTSTSNSW